MLSVRQSGLAVLLVIWTLTASCQGCNQTFTALTAGIGYSAHYDPNSTYCWWLITAPAGYNILLTVYQLDIECGYDVVRAYAGNSSEGGYLGEFCHLPDGSLFGVSGNQLYITFTNGKFSPYSVFYMQYSFYGGNCGRFIDTSPGIIKSPNYPDPYINDLACTWMIEAPVGHSILLDILNVSTECEYDYVTIYDGFSKTNASRYYRFCHLYERVLIASSTRYVYITFNSDITETRQGFIMEYSFYNCNAVLTEPNGSIISPGYPQRYPNYFHCSWLIVADEGKRIILTLENVNTECFYDYVYVFDGLKNDAPLLGRFCQANNNRIESTSNALYILFQTDSTVSYGGFKATYLLTV